MVKTTLLYLRNYWNGNISKIAPKCQKNKNITISSIEKVSSTKNYFFYLLQLALNFQKDRFNNKDFSRGWTVPLMVLELKFKVAKLYFSGECGNQAVSGPISYATGCIEVKILFDEKKRELCRIIII